MTCVLVLFVRQCMGRRSQTNLFCLVPQAPVVGYLMLIIKVKNFAPMIDLRVKVRRPHILSYNKATLCWLQTIHSFVRKGIECLTYVSYLLVTLVGSIEGCNHEAV